MADDTVLPQATPPSPAFSVAQQFSPAEIGARSAALDKTEAQHEQQRYSEEQMLQGRLAGAENAPLPARQEVPLPARPKSAIDGKQVNEFATALMAIAMLSTARGGQDRWINTLNSLNGAMSGFVQSNQAKVQQQYENYDRQFKEAMQMQDRADKEYQSILEQRNKSINQISREMSIAAAKWGHVQVQDAAQRRSVDEMWKTAEQMATAHERLQLQHEAMSERLQIAMALHNLVRTPGGGLAPGESGGKPEDRANLVALARSGLPRTQVVGGYGKQATELWRQVEGDAIDQIMKENPNMSRIDAAREFAFEQINLKGVTGSVQQLEKMRGATVQAVSQLEFNIQKTKEALKDIPSSDISPVVNAIARGKEKWTGDPRYQRLFYFMTATAQESARILQGGQASVAQLHKGAREEAKQWADIDMTPEAFVDGVAPAMLEEGRERIQTFSDAINYQRTGGADGQSGAVPLPNGQPAGTVVKPPLPKTNAKGWRLMTDKNGNTAYVSADGKQYEDPK